MPNPPQFLGKGSLTWRRPDSFSQALRQGERRHGAHAAWPLPLPSSSFPSRRSRLLSQLQRSCRASRSTPLPLCSTGRVPAGDQRQDPAPVGHRSTSLCLLPGQGDRPSPLYRRPRPRAVVHSSPRSRVRARRKTLSAAGFLPGPHRAGTLLPVFAWEHQFVELVAPNRSFSVGPYDDKCETPSLSTRDVSPTAPPGSTTSRLNSSAPSPPRPPVSLTSRCADPPHPDARPTRPVGGQ